MNALEFEARKAALARAILNTESGEIINEVSRSYRQAVEREMPGRYSPDEIKSRLQDTEADALARRGLTTEEVMAQSEKWSNEVNEPYADYKTNCNTTTQMTTISSTELHRNINKYLDLANNRQVVIQRQSETFILRKENYLLPDDDLQRAITADELLLGIEEDIRDAFRQRNK